MGEIAEAMINGDLCENCGEYIGSGDGYPRRCSACQGKPITGASIEKPFRCRCGKRFAQKNSLIQHQVSKGKH